MLRPPTEGEDIVADYTTLGLTLGRHPLALLRRRLTARGIVSAMELQARSHGSQAYTAGLVICRQRPSSANGVVFVTLEDETGHINLIVWQRIAAQARRALLGAHLLAARGTIQRQDGVLHLVAQRLEDLSGWLGALAPRSRDFC